MNRRKNAYLRLALAKLEDKYINLPELLNIDKFTLSKWWRTGNGNISITVIEEILDNHGIPKVEIKK